MIAVLVHALCHGKTGKILCQNTHFITLHFTNFKNTSSSFSTNQAGALPASLRGHDFPCVLIPLKVPSHLLLPALRAQPSAATFHFTVFCLFAFCFYFIVVVLFLFLFVCLFFFFFVFFFSGGGGGDNFMCSFPTGSSTPRLCGSISSFFLEGSLTGLVRSCWLKSSLGCDQSSSNPIEFLPSHCLFTAFCRGCAHIFSDNYLH